MPYCPFRHFPPRVAPRGFVRLACLIHAANVHSEPGSNPSKKRPFSRDAAPRFIHQALSREGPAGQFPRACARCPRDVAVPGFKTSGKADLVARPGQRADELATTMLETQTDLDNRVLQPTCQRAVPRAGRRSNARCSRVREAPRDWPAGVKHNALPAAYLRAAEGGLRPKGRAPQAWQSLGNATGAGRLS